MLPAAFRPSRALSLLNVTSVGLTLAAITGGALASFAGDELFFGHVALMVALPTLAVGTAWAALLRWRRTVWQGQMPWGWLLSLPLAGLDAALVGSWPQLNPKAWWRGALAGLVSGAPLWVPTLMVVLMIVGPPLAWSQRQARRGLEGAERGELAVGAFCALLSLGSLAVLLARGHMPWSPPSYNPEVIEDLGTGVTAAGHLADETRARGGLALLSLLGALSGASLVALASARRRRRRALIASAESGARSDYRVERTPAGRVLVRVRVAGDDYRQADADEESFALDESARFVPGISPRSPGGVRLPGP